MSQSPDEIAAQVMESKPCPQCNMFPDTEYDAGLYYIVCPECKIMSGPEEVWRSCCIEWNGDIQREWKK